MESIHESHSDKFLVDYPCLSDFDLAAGFSSASLLKFLTSIPYSSFCFPSCDNSI